MQAIIFPLLRAVSTILTHGIILFLMGEVKKSTKETLIKWIGMVLLSLFVAIAIMLFLGWNETSVFLVYAEIGITIMISFCFIFKGPFAKNLFIVMSYSTYFMMSVSLSEKISDMYFNHNLNAMLIIRLIISLVYVLALLLGLSKELKEFTRGIEHGWIPLALYATLTVLSVSVMSLTNVFETETRELNYRWFFLVFIIITASYIVLFRTIKLLRSESELMDARMLQGWLISELEGEKESVETAKRIRHDYRHHASLIINLLKIGNVKEAMEYLERYDHFFEDTKIITWSENPIFNAFCRIAQHRTQNNGIKLEIKTDVPEKININDTDLTVLLGNLFENAIYAAVRSENPYIRFQGIVKSQTLKIQIENSLNPKESILFDEDGLPLSEKPSGGIGMRSVRAVTEHYHGLLRCKQEDSIFKAQIILPLEDKERITPYIFK